MSIDGLDSLSAACYTVPWRPRKRARTRPAKVAAAHEPSSPFPQLEAEIGAAASELRYQGYLDSVQALDRLFERCVQEIYAPLFADLKSFLGPQRSTFEDHQDRGTGKDLYIPGFDQAPDGRSAEAGPSALRTAFLISASTPTFSSLSHRLVSHISATAPTAGEVASPTITVTLDRSECPTVSLAIRLLVARFITQASAVSEAVEGGQAAEAELALVEANAAGGRYDGNLQILKSWYVRRFATPFAEQTASMQQERPSLVLHLPSIEAVEPAVLSDLLLSLQSFSRDLDESLVRTHPLQQSGSTLVLILGISSPTGAAPSVGRRGAAVAATPAPWSTYIPRAVLQGMDFSRFALPNKEGVWMELVTNFLTSRLLPISIGPKTFEYVRQTYWEKEADLDAVLDAVRLAIFNHFSGDPLSAFAALARLGHVAPDPGHWTPEVLAKLRLALLGPGNDEGLWLARTYVDLALAESGLRAGVERLLSDDDFLIQQVLALRLQRSILAYRQEVMIKFLAHGFQTLHKLDSAGSAVRAAAALDGFLQQREAEMTSSMLTLVVSQCLQASTGSIEADGRPLPTILLLSNGLTKLCTAARRLQIRDFEAFLDDFVLFAEVETAALEMSREESGEADALEDPFFALELEEMENFLAALRTFQQRLTHLLKAAGGELMGRSFEHLDDNVEQPINAPAADGASADDPNRQAQIERQLLELEQQRQDRIARVQRRLEAEEKVVGLKREVTDWIASQVRSFLDWDSLTEGQTGADGIVGLIKDIWWHDSHDSSAALLDACPRAGLLRPLADPHAFLELLHGLGASQSEGDDGDGETKPDGAEHALPDISRAYHLYRECGKNVNLADWFEAFRQNLDQAAPSAALLLNGGAGRRKGKKERSDRKQDEDDGEGEEGAEEDQGEEDDEEDDEDDDEELLTATPSGRRNQRQAASSRAATKRTYADSEDDDDDDDDSGSSDEYDDVLDTPSKRRSARSQHPAQALPGRTPLKPGSLHLKGGAASVRSSGPATDAQARFALALNELARMGLLRGTRRKNEHVTKAVWDLVPE